MFMAYFWFSVAAIGGSGIPALFLPRRNNGGQWMAVLLNLAGSIAGFLTVIPLLESGVQITGHFPGTLFGEPLVVTLDALSTAFLIPLFLLSVLCSIYGLGYWKQSENPENARKLYFFFGLMVAAMLVLTVARHIALFLIAWEIMALAGYFVLTTQEKEETVREAGWIYFVATHFSTLVLLAFFALYSTARGSMILERFTAGTVDPSIANALFLTALLGFGVKAGLVPVHGWLPPAHANAPSHISAFFSGVFIKMGVYGVLRMIWLFPQPPLWWGILVLTLGMASGLGGVIYAIGQHDIKRLLAYHSIENIGIIFLGIGLALIGLHFNQPVWIALGLAGAILHVWNHSLFKSLLFLAAGSVIHHTHTREIDQLGGLAKRMPWTACGFFVGAVAICGLPPLNGFISELAIYLGLFHALQANPAYSLGAVILSIASLAMIGALASLCFVKVYGIAFLGEARGPEANNVHESSFWMTIPMGILTVLCLAIGLFPILVAPLLQSLITQWPGTSENLSRIFPFQEISFMDGFLVISILLGYGALRWVIRSNPHEEIGTWDCGYRLPSARMQYTASSFAQMITDFFQWILWPIRKTPVIRHLFPSPVSFHSHVPDVILDRGLLPFFRNVAEWIEKLKVIQSGKLQIYFLYIFLTLLVLMILV